MWEQTTAGAGGGGGGADRSKEGAGGKGRGRGRDASAAAASGGGGGKSSLPPVEDMHPSWAARVKQQEVVKVNPRWVHVGRGVCFD